MITDNISTNGNFIQEVIHENDKIFELLKDEFSKATSEILIAAAWFTDPVLFEIIVERLKSGIKVELIIAENADNEKLPFGDINKLGGSCIKIKSVGYGIMHQKFCVIDKKVAIHGSYNYTINARNNNHESVIYTTHKNTVKKLLETFYNIKQRAMAIKDGLLSVEEKVEPEFKKGTTLEQPVSLEETQLQEFERVLSTLIDAEINHFDRDELYKNGYTRSESCNGDFNILPHSLDTLYYNFISDIDISEEQKKLLLVKINEHKSKQLQLLDLESTQKQNTIKIENQTKKEIYTRTIKEKNTEIEKNEKRIEGITGIDIFNKKKEIAGIKDKIDELRKEFIQPKHKLFELVPLIIINSLLLLYLILFYASAAYILAYSHADIAEKIKNGVEIPAPTVFEPNAIPLAFHHGIIGGIFVLLFFILPLSFSLANRFIDNKRFANIISYVIGLIAIDFFVAILISKSIQEAKILTNETNVPWTWGLGLTDINFYLVFVMGAMALLIFKFTYSKLMLCFSERNPSVQAQKVVIEIQQKETLIKACEQEIIEYEKEIEAIKLEVLDFKKIRDDNQYNLDHLPANEVREIERVKNQCTTTGQHFEHIASMYINKVVNNNPRISIDGLKDRINIFLEGWNDFLHSYFAYQKATEKSSKATEIVNLWLEGKLTNNQIDSRLN